MFKPALTAAAAALSLAGCTAGPAPKNLPTSIWAIGQDANISLHTSACRTSNPGAIADLTQVDGALWANRSLTLAAGDRVKVDIAGDTDTLSGIYIIQDGGVLQLRNLRPITAGGLSEQQLTATLQKELVSVGFVQPLATAVSVRMVESGGVPVSISGAVFAEGSVRPGERNPESRVGQSEGPTTGDANAGRTLSAAIRAASGVRPDADITRVHLIRGGSYAVYDLTGKIKGWAAADPLLASGDQIIVPETSCFDPALVRPSPLTQPGIRVHMSNLSRGPNNNAGAAIGEKTGSLPYGTRLLQGLVAMNCVGGSAMQANRRAILISRNPRNQQSIVIERKIEELVRADSRDEVDPFLMPGDALACYDSRWTNFREALSLVSDIANTATPAIILSNAAK